MNNISFYCLTLNPDHERIIRKLSLIPVGLGSKKFSAECLSDKSGFSIAHKNSSYGEYTFHYWLWKNYLPKIKTEWVGFCQYRKFFVNENINNNNIDFTKLNNILINNIGRDYKDFDCILGSKFSVENYKFSKIIKKHFFEFILNPLLLFNKKKRNLKLHFDLFHGKGNLELAINLLDSKNKYEFTQFMINNTAFNPHNMFVCKTRILQDYYEVVFPWLQKCENLFGFNGSQNYGLKRIYGFLAERFLSYWFSKNYKVKEFPILVKDISDYKNL